MDKQRRLRHSVYGCWLNDDASGLAQSIADHNGLVCCQLSVELFVGPAPSTVLYPKTWPLLQIDELCIGKSKTGNTLVKYIHILRSTDGGLTTRRQLPQ